MSTGVGDCPYRGANPAAPRRLLGARVKRTWTGGTTTGLCVSHTPSHNNWVVRGAAVLGPTRLRCLPARKHTNPARGAQRPLFVRGRGCVVSSDDSRTRLGIPSAR